MSWQDRAAAKSSERENGATHGHVKLEMNELVRWGRMHDAAKSGETKQERLAENEMGQERLAETGKQSEIKMQLVKGIKTGLGTGLEKLAENRVSEENDGIPHFQNLSRCSVFP
jgi:hypothetical protein